MLNKQFTYEIITALLQDKELLLREDLPDAICILLRPFLGKRKLLKVPVKIATQVETILHRHHICIRCRNQKLKHPTDLYCRMCKHSLKENAKNKLEKESSNDQGF